MIRRLLQFYQHAVRARGVDEGDERVRATYGSNYDRLTRVKHKYDPENFFKVNQNITAQA